MSRPKFWQRRIYVHPIQRKYLVLSLIPLVICSVAIIVLVFLPTDLLLLGRVSEFEQAVTTTCVASLGRRLWPAIFLSMFVVAGLSVFASHTLGGPLLRLETIGKRLAAGEFPEPIRVRHGDDLEGMAGTLDEAVANLRLALIRIRDQGELARERAGALRRDLSAGRVTPATLSPQLQAITASLDEIHEAIQPFRL